MKPVVYTLGFWSAVASAGFALVYIFGQLAEWLGWLGSAGGPHSASTPLGIAVLLTPSLLLAPAFLLTIVSVHALASPDRKIWSHAATLFATAYLVMIMITYYVQLAWVMPRLAAGRTAGMEAFLFVPFDSFLYAIDILGYSLMSVSTWFAALVFRGPTRWLLAANGLLVPFLALQLYWHDLIWIASLWAITFPAALSAVARVFRHPENALA